MKILFIDDEPGRMAAVVAELKWRGHEVTFESTVDPALTRLRDQTQHFDLVVLDISMTAGKEFEIQDTDQGARTGLAFYDALRISRPTIKVVIYTNVADPGVEARFEKEDHRLCRFIRKPTVLAFQFGEEIERFVSG